MPGAQQADLPSESSGSAAPPRLPAVFIFFLAMVAMVAVGLVGITLLALRNAPREPLPVLAEVPDFELVDQTGATVRRADFAGRPWLANFIFTRCPAVCPRMTQQMRAVAEALPAGAPVRIASFSVDPEHDTPEVLAEFAAKHGATGDWLFLTGSRQAGDVEAIDQLTIKGFLLPVDRSQPEEVTTPGSGPIIHSNRFVLVDGQAKIRGYYDSFDEADVDRLLADVRRLLATRLAAPR